MSCDARLRVIRRRTTPRTRPVIILLAILAIVPVLVVIILAIVTIIRGRIYRIEIGNGILDLVVDNRWEIALSISDMIRVTRVVFDLLASHRGTARIRVFKGALLGRVIRHVLVPRGALHRLGLFMTGFATRGRDEMIS